ncbi:MFS general substrate transporter [Penicillium sp. IBT 16267x]|nr:MFS general substrate transporter [Penicillium sp. IBT 16267x]
MVERTVSTSPPGNVVVEPKAQQRKPLAPSVLSRPQKIATITLVCAITFVGPASVGIYYPSLGLLARDFHVSYSDISLAVTAFMICQALFPLLIAGFSDERGRRPLLLAGLIVCIGINISLARQTSFAGFMILRCVQGCCASGTSVAAMATVNDIIRPVERKDYRIFTSVAYTLAPVTCPIVGGLLAQKFGWPSIFYFQGVIAAFLLILVALFHHETCRAQVGNGSVPPKRWNRPLIDIFWQRPAISPNLETSVLLRRRLTPLQTIKLAFRMPAFLLILFQATLFSGSIALIVTIPVLFAKKFQFNILEIGATHLAYALGGFTSRWIIVPLSDANIQRHKRFAGVTEGSDQSSEMRTDRARLQVIIPTVYLGCACAMVYGWILHYNVHVAGPIVMLFLLGNTLIGASSLLTGLMLHLNPQQPASALAAMNSFRFICAAGTAAAATPLIKAVGTGWMGTIIALVYCGASSVLWIVYMYGYRWRPGTAPIISGST